MAPGRVQGILQGILSFVGLVAICTALGYGAWKLLTRPHKRDTETAVRRAAPPNDSLGFVSVAGEGVDLEIVAPSGMRTSTAAGVSGARIPRSESQVDCPGFSAPGGRESECTASVHVNAPPPGDYTIVARATETRAVVLNVGWATASQVQHGAFDVRVQVARGGATSFRIIVARESVSQRSEPRSGAP